MSAQRPLIILCAVAAIWGAWQLTRHEPKSTGLHLTTKPIARMPPLRAEILKDEAPVEPRLSAAVPQPSEGAALPVQTSAPLPPAAPPTLSTQPVSQPSSASLPAARFAPPSSASSPPLIGAPAPAVERGQAGSLQPESGEPVELAEIRVPAKGEPTALLKITAHLATGIETTLWQGYERLDLSPGEHVFSVPPGTVATGVQLHVDEARLTGEFTGRGSIDEVELVSPDGRRHRARASAPVSIDSTGNVQLPKLPDDLTLGGALIR